MAQTVNAPNVVGTDNFPVTQVYDSASGTLLPVSAGASTTDTSHGSQKSAPLQVALGPTSATYGHVILDANTVATYAATYLGLTPASACTDLAILNGSTKVIRVTRVVVSALTTAATGATLDLVLAVRSAANTGGTAVTAATLVPYDSNDPAATATFTAYSANPTTGTLVGNVFVTKFQQALGTPTATDFPTNQPFVAQFGITDSKPIVLRGAAQGLAINFNGATFAAGASVDITVEWTEAAA